MTIEQTPGDAIRSRLLAGVTPEIAALTSLPIQYWPSRLSDEIRLVHIRARRMLFQAVKEGFITRPSVCEVCAGNARQLEAHHEDYLQPFIVQWLCGPCHRWYHRAIEA